MTSVEPRSTQVRKAVVLCSGEGTRLRRFSFSSPKHLMPVANRPVIAWIFDTLTESGIEDVAVVVSPLNERILRRELGARTEHGMSLSFVVQEEPKGLAHAVACAREFVAGDSFLLYLGDNLLESGVVEIVRGFRSGTHAAGIALIEVPDSSHFGVVRLEGKTIIELIEKPPEPPSNWAVAGAYVFPQRIFQAIERVTPSQRGELEITDAIQLLIRDQWNVNAHFVQGWWKDVGLPKDLILASELLMNRGVPRTCGDVDTSSMMDGLVVVEKGASVRGSTLQGPCIVGYDAQIVNSKIGPNVAVGDACRIEGSQIRSERIFRWTRRVLSMLCNSIVGRRSRLVPTSSDVCYTALVGADSFVYLRP
ncbi:glucose-1-phosphate thymidylyltransferase [Candidatus Bipolaricaulota bacterium]